VIRWLFAVIFEAFLHFLQLVNQAVDSELQRPDGSEGGREANQEIRRGRRFTDEPGRVRKKTGAPLCRCVQP
jgi:hypothetical protein